MKMIPYIRVSEYKEHTLKIRKSKTMQAVSFFKALSDPTRLKLVLLLRQHDSLCVCDITQLLAQPQPTISRHLNHLKQANILTSERRGTWMWYGLNKQMTPWCRQVIEQIELSNDAEPKD